MINESAERLDGSIATATPDGVASHNNKNPGRASGGSLDDSQQHRPASSRPFCSQKLSLTEEEEQ